AARCHDENVHVARTLSANSTASPVRAMAAKSRAWTRCASPPKPRTSRMTSRCGSSSSSTTRRPMGRSSSRSASSAPRPPSTSAATLSAVDQADGYLQRLSAELKEVTYADDLEVPTGRQSEPCLGKLRWAETDRGVAGESKTFARYLGKSVELPVVVLVMDDGQSVVPARQV